MFDFDQVEDVNAVGLVMIHPCSESSTSTRLGDVADGAKVEDRIGSSFTLVGTGAAQGAYVVRDSNGRMYQADGGTLVKVLA